MKSISIIAALLTFFSFLLILAAAVLFLLQGRQALRADLFDLQEEVQAQDQSINEFQSTAAARDMLLSTTQAQLSTAEASLSTREAELAQSQEALSNIEATQTAGASTAEDEPPLVEIMQPEDGAQVEAGDPLDLLIVGADANGINSLQLEIGERVITFTDNGTNPRVFTHRVLSPAPGELVITATLTSDTDLSASDVISVIVQEEPTPTPETATSTPEVFLPQNGALFSQYSSTRQQSH
jgi:hypothetical protein